LCVQKFQNDIFNKRFLIPTDCKVAPNVLTKDDELLPVIVLEKDQAKVNPIQIAKTLFPPDFLYLLIHPHKTKTFCEFILVDTDSIEIFHTQDKQGNIQFSKIKILNILSHQDWNQPLFQQKSLSRSFLPQHYTYYNYMDAWYHVLYLVDVFHKLALGILLFTSLPWKSCSLCFVL
ncbi:hypothetical protein CR513_30262, partial [Mucuna pruriens]